MGSFSIWHWLIVLVVVLILFGGKGKISQIMGDVGKGLNAFRKSVKEDDTPEDRRSLAEHRSIDDSEARKDWGWRHDYDAGRKL